MRKIPLLLSLLLLFNLLAGFAYAAPSGAEIQATTPADHAKGVPVDTKQLSMTFSTPLKPGSGKISIKEAVTETLFAEIMVSGVGSLTDTILIDIPASAGNMSPGTDYVVTGTDGVFVDKDGVGIPSFSWGFKTLTAGSITPTATLQTPQVNGTSVSLSLTFDQVVHKAASGTIYIKKASTNEAVAAYPVTGTDVALSTVTDAGIDKSVVTFSASNLARGERYYVLIDKGAFLNDDDLAYSGISSAQAWTFNIKGDKVALQSTLPSNSQGEVVTNTIQLNFSRPVYPDSGSIVVKLANDTQAARVSVTSSSVSGGGTSKITVKLPITLAASTSYTVTIPQGAFEDTDGNAYPEAADYAWAFRTGTSASTQLSISGLWPADRSTNVSLNPSITASFNRTVMASTGNTSFTNGTNGITLRKSGTTTLPSATVSVSGKTVAITPTASLESGSTYYVDITSGALLDAATNTTFAGISGASSWSFTVGSSDKTAPLLQSAAMYSNNTIQLQYNEPLDASVNLLTSSFLVTVNGETRSLSNAYVSGSSVYLSLGTGVAVGQVIKVSYTQGLRPVQDVSKNAAGSFSNYDVSNGVTSSLPKPKDGYVSGSSLVLTFPDSLQSVSSYAYSQFSVTQDGSSIGVRSLSQSGATVYLTLNSAVTNGAVVKVSYSPGAYPLQDYRGQNVSAFSDFYVRNHSDARAPQLTSIDGSGNKIVLTYDEALSTTNIPLKSQYSVLVGNSAVYVTAVSIASNQVTLTLASSFTSSQSVTLSYVSAANGVSDLNGNLAGYINLASVTAAATVIEGISSMTVNGDTLTIQYSSPIIYNSSAIYTGLYYLQVNQTVRDINSATAGSSSVVLKLASPVTAGQSVVLSFMTGSSPSLYDQSGNAIKAFSSATVTNVTPASTAANGAGASLPSNMTQLDSSLFGTGGYVIGVSSTSSSTASSSRNGQTVNRNVIDTTKMDSSLKYMESSAPAGSSNLVFEVPSTDKGAYVGLPLQPLYDAYSTGKSLSVGVRHGDALVLIPLNKIPFADITKSLGTGFSSGYMWVQMERVVKEKLSVPTEQGGVTSVPLVDPVDLFISIGSVLGANRTELNISEEKIYIRTANKVSTAQTSMTRYDNTAGKAYFLPTHMQVNNTNSVLSSTLNAGIILVGPSSGFVSYADISSHWAKSAITELANKLIVAQRSPNMFQPKLNITRAEFAEYISKGLGLTPDASAAMRFGDVYQSLSSAGYIGAAVKAGIVNGATDGTFKPGSNITREQMALMMVRAMAAAGQDIELNSPSSQILSRFKDNKGIGDKQTVAKAVQAGIIQGTSSGTFNPKGTATRAEAAVMIKRVLDKLGYLQ